MMILDAIDHVRGRQTGLVPLVKGLEKEENETQADEDDAGEDEKEASAVF